MGIIKALTGRTLRKLVTGNPGDIDEFIDAVESRGSERINVTYRLGVIEGQNPDTYTTTGRVVFQAGDIEFTKRPWLLFPPQSMGSLHRYAEKDLKKLKLRGIEFAEQEVDKSCPL